jgi:tetratricopeptide (TPR) repeat protein
MTNARDIFFVCAMSLAALGGLRPAMAANPHAAEDELAMVPSWCRYGGAPLRGARAIAEIPNPLIRYKLNAMTASGCSGIHHYCYALIWTNRAYAASDVRAEVRHGMMGEAVDDFQYVLRNSKGRNTCVLFPDIYTKIGDLSLMREDLPAAERNYQQALTLKPGYVGAFNGLSDLFESRGEHDKAIEALEAGIKANPGSTALKKKLARIQAGNSNNNKEPSTVPAVP